MLSSILLHCHASSSPHTNPHRRRASSILRDSNYPRHSNSNAAASLWMQWDATARQGMTKEGHAAVRRWRLASQKDDGSRLGFEMSPGDGCAWGLTVD
ncbi:hypothetical protein Droror1_Dr00003071 [Drosera rotundifolia]